MRGVLRQAGGGDARRERGVRFCLTGHPGQARMLVRRGEAATGGREHRETRTVELGKGGERF